MATYDIDNLPSRLKAGDIINCPYSESVKSLALPKGTFQFECWGAQGGNTYISTDTYGGNGGFSSGFFVNDQKNRAIYLACGGRGVDGPSTSSATGYPGGFNGGGASGRYGGGSGGGATHISLIDGLLSDLESSIAYILIVAGGGGGAFGYSSTTYCYKGGNGGGISGGDGGVYSTSYTPAGGGTQTSGGVGNPGYNYVGFAGSFGKGGDANVSGSRCVGGGGGGGLYGGGGSGGTSSSTTSYVRRGSGGGGGSGFVSSSLISASTVQETSSTNPDTSKNGFIRITVIDIQSLNLRPKINGTWKNSSDSFAKVNGAWKHVSSAYTKVNGVWKPVS